MSAGGVRRADQRVQLIGRTIREGDFGPPVELSGTRRQERPRQPSPDRLRERAVRQTQDDGRLGEEREHGRADEVRLGAEHLSGDNRGERQKALAEGGDEIAG
jgi:hypothetical protein